MNIKNIEKGLENSLKWSLYKHRIFKNCNRKFLFKYLDFLVLKEQKLLVSLLKKIKMLKHFQGDLIHIFIRIIINNFINNNPIDFEDIKRKFETQFWNNINNSKNLIDKNIDFNNINENILYRNTYIWEFFYEYSITDKDLENIYNSSLVALSNFYKYFINNSSKFFKDYDILWIDSGFINNQKSKIIEYNLKIINNNIIILLNPDFVIINKDKKEIIIYDWKTTKKEELDSNQFKLYNLYYNNIYPDFSIKNFVIYLFPNIEEEFINIENLENFSEFILQSYKEIKNKMQNIYIDLKKQNEINQNIIKKIYEYFPLNDDLSICSFCEFRKICFNL
ncbi:MAG: hypothetical protein ACPL1F_02080 [bacterium]